MTIEFLFIKKLFKRLLVLGVVVIPVFCSGDSSVNGLMSNNSTKPIPLLFANSNVSGSFFPYIKDREIAFLITFSAVAPQASHKPWIWSESRGVYEVGSKLEDAVKVFIFDARSDMDFADVWMWRAGRTGGVGCADDMYWKHDDASGGPKVTLTEDGVSADAGLLCWYSRFQSSFAGDEVKRFYNRVPTESCADVKAEGTWSDGQWSVTFSRALITLQEDDIPLRRGLDYIAVIAVRDQTSGLFTVAKQVQFTINRKE